MTPHKKVINGIPFISWGQAARMDYPDKEVVNPSMAACREMITGYLRYLGLESDCLESESNFEAIENASIEDYKKQIASGRPVVFEAMSLTPYAHPVSPMASIGFEMHQAGPYTGLLGPMAPLDTIKEYEGSIPGMTARESVYAASRIGVGYDEAKRAAILHCPTFGPAWEVNYDDFDIMRKICSPTLTAIKTERFMSTEDAKDTKAYSAASIDQSSAFYLIHAIALSISAKSVDDIKLAEDYLLKGLSIQGLSKSYRHLFLLELAGHIMSRDKEAAIACIEEAIELLPENPRAHQLLAWTLRRPFKFIKFSKAVIKGTAIIGRDNSKTVLSRKLPDDFWIPSSMGLWGNCEINF